MVWRVQKNNTRKKTLNKVVFLSSVEPSAGKKHSTKTLFAECKKTLGKDLLCRLSSVFFFLHSAKKVFFLALGSILGKEATLLSVFFRVLFFVLCKEPVSGSILSFF